MINVSLESLLSEYFPSLVVTVHLISLRCPPTLCWSLDLFWGAAHILIWSYSYVFLRAMSAAIRASAFSFWELSVIFYICHRHTVCLVDCMDLICCLYKWWEGLGSSSLVTLPWVSIVVLFPPLPVGHPWGLLLRLPMRTWFCPREGQVWRWCSCLGRRGSGSTRYSGE